MEDADCADGSVSDDVVDVAVSASGVASRSDKPPAAVSPPPSRGSRGAGGISIAAHGCWLTFLHSQKFIACDADVVDAEFLRVRLSDRHVFCDYAPSNSSSASRLACSVFNSANSWSMP